VSKLTTESLEKLNCYNKAASLHFWPLSKERLKIVLTNKDDNGKATAGATSTVMLGTRVENFRERIWNNQNECGKLWSEWETVQQKINDLSQSVCFDATGKEQKDPSGKTTMPSPGAHMSDRDRNIWHTELATLEAEMHHVRQVAVSKMAKSEDELDVADAQRQKELMALVGFE
jgi:hypothetical protein